MARTRWTADQCEHAAEIVDRFYEANGGQNLCGCALSSDDGIRDTGELCIYCEVRAFRRSLQDEGGDDE